MRVSIRLGAGDYRLGLKQACRAILAVDNALGLSPASLAQRSSALAAEGNGGQLLVGGAIHEELTMSDRVRNRVTAGRDW